MVPPCARLGNDLGFVNIVTAGTVLMFVLSLVMSRDGNQIGLSPSSVALRVLGASGASPVFEFGWWWTVLTAGWLHGGILHIFFNVLWIRQLGPEIANLYGAGRMILIYTVAGIIGFTLSTLMFFLSIPFFGAGLTVGASASIFGFLGALVHYGRRTGSSHIGQAGIQYAVFMGIMGFVFPGVDNAAHLGGFVGRVSRVDDSRSAQTGTHRSSPGRGGVSGVDLCRPGGHDRSRASVSQITPAHWIRRPRY